MREQFIYGLKIQFENISQDNMRLKKIGGYNNHNIMTITTKTKITLLSPVHFGPKKGKCIPKTVR